jgi:prophage tail gpP-like protein
MIPSGQFSAGPVDPDEVAIAIDRKTWRFWADLEIRRALDNFSTVAFTAPFEVERKEFKDTFRPFSFKPLTVGVGGSDLFTGTMIDVVPKIDKDGKRVSVSAYSKPAVLADSDAPASALPFETNDLTLKQIADQLCAPFGLTVVLEGPAGSKFKRSRFGKKFKHHTSQPDGKVHDYLVGLAKQRALVMSDTPKGELLFRQSAQPGNAVARLKEGVPPVLSVAPTFSPQEYFSEITGYVAGKHGHRGAKQTERNHRLSSSGVLRVHSFLLDDIEKGDAPSAVRAKLGRMYANVLAIVVEVPTWRDPKGNLWEPNTTIKLTAPDAMVYTECEFLIRDVILRQSRDARSAALGLVLPGAFTGDIPTKLPWD